MLDKRDFRLISGMVSAGLQILCVKSFGIFFEIRVWPRFC